MQSPRRTSARGVTRRPVAGGGAGIRDPGRRNETRSAVDTDRDAKTAVDSLKETLARGYPPWVKDVEERRKRARNLYLTLQFEHPLSPLAQSLDNLWLGTTHTLITAYRQSVAAAEADIAQAAQALLQGQGQGLVPLLGGRDKRRNPAQNGSASIPGQDRDRDRDRGQALQVELRKRLTRFRQALLSEEEFYRHLIGRIVRFYGLQFLTGSTLAEVGIGGRNEAIAAHIASNTAVDGANGNHAGEVEAGPAPITENERKGKLKLVCKGLICLGDLERYKEQYSEKTRREAKDRLISDGAKNGNKREEVYARAKVYYDVARSLVSDDGSAYNQLAVISTYTSDDFSTVYYYFRAMAVKQAFKGVEEILDKFFRKYDERTSNLQDESRERSTQEGFIEEYLSVISALYRRSDLSNAARLGPYLTDNLDRLLRDRLLSSETVVKLIAIAIGSHWYARSGTAASTNRGQSDNSSTGTAEDIATCNILDIIGVLFNVATGELEVVLRSEGFKGMDDSALLLDDDLDTITQLANHISAPLRRILPSLRIASKWLKLHLEYLARFGNSQESSVSEAIARVWQRYTNMIGAFANLFPITQLPHLTQALEEDRDMRGFMPLHRGMSGSAVGESDVSANGMASDSNEAVHPNEEQLMRIGDLQIDARLIIQAAALIGFNPLDVDLQASMPYRQQDDNDIASVSTETEDDPVSQAMRAGLGVEHVDGFSMADIDEQRYHVDDEDEDDDEEQIVWPGALRQATQQHTAFAPISTPQQAQQTQHRPSTAHDLLQNLQLDKTFPAPGYSSPSGPGPVPTGQLTRGTSGTPLASAPSPSLLFGASADKTGAGASIWTMTREESQKGVKRSSLATTAMSPSNPTASSPSSTAQVNPVAAPALNSQSIWAHAGGPGAATSSVSGPPSVPAPSTASYGYTPSPGFQYSQNQQAQNQGQSGVPRLPVQWSDPMSLLNLGSSITNGAWSSPNGTFPPPSASGPSAAISSNTHSPSYSATPNSNMFGNPSMWAGLGNNGVYSSPAGYAAYGSPVQIPQPNERARDPTVAGIGSAYSGA